MTRLVLILAMLSASHNFACTTPPKPSVQKEAPACLDRPWECVRPARIAQPAPPAIVPARGQFMRKFPQVK